MEPHFDGRINGQTDRPSLRDARKLPKRKCEKKDRKTQGCIWRAFRAFPGRPWRRTQDSVDTKQMTKERKKKKKMSGKREKCVKKKNGKKKKKWTEINGKR